MFYKLLADYRAPWNNGLPCPDFSSENCAELITRQAMYVLGHRVTTVVMETQQYVPFKARSQKYGKRLLSLSCLSGRPSARKNSTPTKRIIIKFDDWSFFENVSRKFQFDSDLTRITGILLEDLRAFMKCCWMLRRKMFQTQAVESIKTYILQAITFFSKIVPWKNVVPYVRCGYLTQPQNLLSVRHRMIEHLQTARNYTPTEDKVRRGRPKRW